VATKGQSSLESNPLIDCVAIWNENSNRVFDNMEIPIHRLFSFSFFSFFFFFVGYTIPIYKLDIIFFRSLFTWNYIHPNFVLFHFLEFLAILNF
jgi:hypothetical protein